MVFRYPEIRGLWFPLVADLACQNIRLRLTYLDLGQGRSAHIVGKLLSGEGMQLHPDPMSLARDGLWDNYTITP